MEHVSSRTVVRMLVVAAAAALTVAGCGRAIPDAAAEPQPPAAGTPSTKPVAVALVPVEHGTLDRPLRAGGVLRQKSEVDLAFTVGGVLSVLLVDEGARVQRGQVLARLDSTEVGAAAAQARENVAKADRDLGRVKTLHGSGALPLADLQNAETGAAVAHAQLASADFAARHSVIVAPDDGLIDQRLAEKGEVLSPGRAVFRMSGRSKGAVVRVALADKDVLGLVVGQPAEVSLDAEPDERLPATISTLATAAASATGTFDVEVKLDTAPERVLSGMTAKVTIPRVVSPHATVPLASLVRASGNAGFVYVVREGRAHREPVRIAFVLGDKAALSAGLDGTDRVVGAGAALLEDGSPVDVRP